MPGSLGGEPHQVERALEAAHPDAWHPGVPAVFDLGAVNFVRPYGALQLLRTCECVLAA
jgi:hypothetical protein